jgi:hypothetical protein
MFWYKLRVFWFWATHPHELLALWCLAALLAAPNPEEA